MISKCSTILFYLDIIATRVLTRGAAIAYQQAMHETLPTEGSTPGKVLRRFFMDPLGLSAYRIATDLEVPPIAISEILRGKRAISPAMALRLGLYFGVDSQFWLSLQAAHNIQKAAANGNGGSAEAPKNHTVTRCPALEGREFVIRETKTSAARHWQVMITKARPATTSHPGKAKRRSKQS
jgi:addiction module HigA family antidote